MSVACIIERFPQLDKAVDWLPLGTFPTPVEPLSDLSQGLGCDIWIKREDQSGPHYGGNKVRKLEALLGRAKAAGCERILTAGPLGSHHVLAVALYAHQHGLKTHALLTPQPLTDYVQKTRQQIEGLAARVTRSPFQFLTPVMAMKAMAHYYGKDQPFMPGLILPGGAQSHGILGDIGAAFELEEQILAGELPRPDAIILPLGTGGTALGLAVGLAMIGADTEVWAVRATHPFFANAFFLKRMARGLLADLKAWGLNPPPINQVMRKILIDGSQLGAGYGIPTAGALRAVRQFASWGLQLEPTYTGKAAAALIGLGESVGGRLLFWNTFNSRPILLPQPSPLRLESGR